MKNDNQPTSNRSIHTHTLFSKATFSLPLRWRRSTLALVTAIAVISASFYGFTRQPIAAAGTGDIIYAITATKLLLKFNSTTPSTTQSVAVTGMLANETPVGIDFRPATGQLYAIGFTAPNALRLYTIDPATGAATQIGPGLTIPQSAGVVAGSDFGFDFNPTVDRIRVVSNTRDNFRLNPDSGAVAGVDTALTAGANVVGVAYDRNYVSSPQPPTTLYGIDATTDQLVRIGGIDSNPSPNGGAVTAVGNLGVNTNNLVGFDIANDSVGPAYASMTTGAGNSGLYSINLATGAATLIGAINAGNVPVVDIAVAPAGVVQFNIVSNVVSESAGMANITVARTGGDCGTVTVNFATSNGTAVAGQDYTAVATTLTFGPGVTSRTVAVPILSDNLDELDETFTVTLSANAGGRLAVPATSIITIADDDLSAISINDAAIAEGNFGQSDMTFTVSLSNPSFQTVTVNYATQNGTATAGTDYVAANGTVTFMPGETSKPVIIKVIGDVEISEGDETLFVNLSNAVNGSINDGQGRGLIVNDDARLDGPGAPVPVENSVVNDQKAGSILVYPVYTSGPTDSTTQNTRFSITNADGGSSINVHLFLIDGTSCSVSDTYICLTKNQTATFLASDLDPGSTGYMIAVAVNGDGCPIIFNALLGDEYVKFPTGHAANLGAEAIAGLAGLVANPLCNQDTPTAVLPFNGISYQPLPRTLAADNLPDRASGNDTMLVVDRIGGSLIAGASALGPIFGILYDDAENSASFGFTSGGCQFRSSLSNNFPRTTPRYEQLISANHSGWLKLWGDNDIAILGATINANPNAAGSSNAFNQGHNLHILKVTTTATLTIPVFPPTCF